MAFTATVTASAGCANGFPTGNVAFYSNYVVNGQPTSFQVGDPVTLAADDDGGRRRPRRS